MLVRFLRYLGGSDFLEMSEQLFQRAGIRYACPSHSSALFGRHGALPVDAGQPLPSLEPMSPPRPSLGGRRGRGRG